MGFGKKVRAIWLDLALDFVANGVSFLDAKPILSRTIKIDNPGPEAIQKVLTGLNRVWFNPPSSCLAARDAALALYRGTDQPPRSLLLHWGMCISTYPFIGVIAEAVGRLLRLQGTAMISDIKRRVGEKFGEREFVERIVRFDVSSFLDWGVLSGAEQKGAYTTGPIIPVVAVKHSAWLIETLLHSRGEESLPLANLRQHPILFPFSLGEIPSALALSKENPRLQSMRQGNNEEILSLAPETSKMH